MTEQPTPTESPAGADLEYDLAHEGSEVAREAALHRPEPSRTGASHVPTTAGDYSGDYGYDLAHDIRGY